MNSPRLLTVTMALLAIGPTATAQVVPFDAQLYGDLAAAWQQYVMSIPVQSNPTTDPTGNNALVAQSGPVYFLAGAPTTDAVVRKFTMPAGKFLFFPLVTVECSTVEADPFHGTNFAELSTCATSFFSGTDALTCTIDSVAVTGLLGFQALSPLYSFRMPPRNNILFLPGVSGGLSVTDGYWLLLSPLPVGDHVIHFTASILGGGFTQDITYQISVR